MIFPFIMNSFPVSITVPGLPCRRFVTNKWIKDIMYEPYYASKNNLQIWQYGPIDVSILKSDRMQNIYQN